MNPTVLPDPRQDARRLVRRYLFGTFAIVFGLNVLLLATNTVLPPSGRVALLAGSLALTLACAVGWRWERARSELTLMAVCAGGMALGVLVANARYVVRKLAPGGPPS